MKDFSFNDAFVFLDSLPCIERDIMELLFSSDIQIDDQDFPEILVRVFGIKRDRAVYRQKRLISKMGNFKK